MDSKLLVGVESFAAELATVRFFPGMPPDMQLQVQLPVELPTAIFTYETLASCTLVTPLAVHSHSLQFLVNFW
jgi:hypothetical protein